MKNKQTLIRLLLIVFGILSAVILSVVYIWAFPQYHIPNSERVTWRQRDY